MEAWRNSDRRQAGREAVVANPLQSPGDYYNRDEESFFRAELEVIIQDISERIWSMEDGKSTVGSLSSLALSLWTVPVGQVEIG